MDRQSKTRFYLIVAIVQVVTLALFCIGTVLLLGFEEVVLSPFIYMIPLWVVLTAANVITTVILFKGQDKCLQDGVTTPEYSGDGVTTPEYSGDGVTTPVYSDEDKTTATHSDDSGSSHRDNYFKTAPRDMSNDSEGGKMI